MARTGPGDRPGFKLTGDSFGTFVGESEWVGVELLFFERVDGEGQPAFVQDKSGNITQMGSGQGYHGSFIKQPWHGLKFGGR